LDQIKLDALKFICESNRALHESRIGRELTLVITIIPFFILSSSFAINEIIEGNVRQFIVLAIFLFIGYSILFTAAFIFLHGSAKANLRNQGLAEVAEDDIIDYLSKEKCGSISSFLESFSKKEVDTKLQSENITYWNGALFKKNYKCLGWTRSFIDKIIHFLEGKEKGNESRPNKNRWLWYVKIVGLTAILSYLAIILAGIFKLITNG